MTLPKLITSQTWVTVRQSTRVVPLNYDVTTVTVQCWIFHDMLLYEHGYTFYFNSRVTQ